MKGRLRLSCFQKKNINRTLTAIVDDIGNEVVFSDPEHEECPALTFRDVQGSLDLKLRLGLFREKEVVSTILGVALVNKVIDLGSSGEIMLMS